MKTRSRFSFAMLTAAILVLLPLAPRVLAQDYDQDPPTRAGRIGYVQGSVSFQPGGQGDWLDAQPNRPLTTGDNLWVDRDSRAEIQIGGTSLRLGPETSLTFLDLGDRVTQLRLSMGSLFFRVRHFGGDDAFEVDAPNLAFNVDQSGEFRLDVNQNGDQTVATVWHGEGEITGAGNSYRLLAGQQGTFSGADQLNYDVEGIGDSDDFGRWAMSRDQREDRIRSREYVSDEMTGYEDLDDYGQWHDVEGYGNVWTPVGVPGDWAPYRYGYWTYVAPWGWTWVEQEPWGFAPFHYGRWAYLGSNWCWVPGPVAVAPVYSPALVAFVGGGGFSIGVGIGGGGGIGWFPLAPGEVFVPWYHTSPRYVQNVNISNTRVNVTQVTNVYNNVTVNHVTNVTYVNQRVNNSVTVVNHDTFVNARPVHNNLVRVDQRQIVSAPVTHEVASNIQPARQSVVGPARAAQLRPPEQAMSRPVVATRQPVAMNRVAPLPGMQRTVAPPPVRTVKAAPPTAAQPLERGARGGANPPAPTNAGARPGQPANRPEPENNRPPQPDNNRPGAMNNSAIPRPGAPENRPAPPDNNRPGVENSRGGVPRPGAPETAPRPSAPDNNRPGATNNNRPTAPENPPPQPENNRPSRNVPRPPSASRPEPAPEQPRPESARPETPRAQPEQPARPPETRPGSAPPPTREQTAPRNQNRPEQPARPPEARPENAPPPTREQAAPRNQIRSEQPPPETRQESEPRPEARPAPPPQQREPQAAPRPENRQSAPKEEKPQKEEKPSKDDKPKDDKPRHGFR